MCVVKFSPHESNDREIFSSMQGVEIMAMMPKTECDIREYLVEGKQEEIFKNMREFLQRVLGRNENELSSVDVCIQDKEEFSKHDEEGYVISGEYTHGRYFPCRKVIGICAGNLAGFISDFCDRMYHEGKCQNRPDAYKLCDLVLLHEYMHAYQHLAEHKCLIHGNKSLEEEANRRAAIVLTAMWNLNEELIRIIIDFYKKKSAFGFGDDFSVDELIAHRMDNDYLAEKFSS